MPRSAESTTAYRGLCNLRRRIDGPLVGMGAALGEGQGRTLTIALTLEVLFLGLSLATLAAVLAFGAAARR